MVDHDAEGSFLADPSPVLNPGALDELGADQRDFFCLGVEVFILFEPARVGCPRHQMASAVNDSGLEIRGRQPVAIDPAICLEEGGH